VQNRTAEQYYRGENGNRYHESRWCSRSEDVQRSRTRFFQDLGNPNKIILDFGCGTGGVLANIDARERIGVEINERAATRARQLLDRVYGSLAEIGTRSVDVIISCHALEHVEHPAQVLRGLHRVGKPGALVRILVPTDMPILLRHHRSWRADDPDMHLYTWTPLTLGNLLTVCGFEVTEARLLPCSDGGRIGALFAADSKGRYSASLFKALRHGRFQSIVSGRKQGGG
jgi:SAM-dependent methyltransferase